jgi:curved DNA-binding protein
MQFRDYYEVMGVPREAKAEDIKRAYRRLARKFHPDVSKEADAEERFKELGEAYAVLKDPEKRAAYDQLGSRWTEGQEFKPPPDWDFHFESGPRSAAYSDFFESLFGGATHRARDDPPLKPAAATGRPRYRYPSRKPSMARLACCRSTKLSSTR